MTSPSDPSDARRGLRERLAEGPVICAEGYLFELERRGYLQAGAFVPEVVLSHPDRVQALHEEFVHAGTDVVQAFTYYAHREKLRLIGQEHLLESMNRQALQIARNVALESGALLAGDVCNSNVFDPADPATVAQVRAMFTEQVGWAAEARHAAGHLGRIGLDPGNQAPELLRIDSINLIGPSFDFRV